MLIEKQDMPYVAMEFMNEVHLEDIDIINEIFELILKYEKDHSLENRTLLENRYKNWINHTVEHFKGEEVMMQEKKFPPYHFHKAEHDRALDKMKNTFNLWRQTDDVQTLKGYFIEELPQWLINHIKSMDTVTAMFLKTGLSPCAVRN